MMIIIEIPCKIEDLIENSIFRVNNKEYQFYCYTKKGIKARILKDIQNFTHPKFFPSHLEVIQLKNLWTKEDLNKHGYCFCGTKLIKDKLSETYGDYCPNEKCDNIS